MADLSPEEINFMRGMVVAQIESRCASVMGATAPEITMRWLTKTVPGARHHSARLLEAGYISDSYGIAKLYRRLTDQGIEYLRQTMGLPVSDLTNFEDRKVFETWIETNVLPAFQRREAR